MGVEFGSSNPEIKKLSEDQREQNIAENQKNGEILNLTNKINTKSEVVQSNKDDDVNKVTEGGSKLQQTKSIENQTTTEALMDPKSEQSEHSPLQKLKNIGYDEIKENMSPESNSLATKIDDKVADIEKEKLPFFIQDTFQDGDYRTVVTKEEVKLYRVFGGQADAGGAFATTDKSASEQDTRQDLALIPEWGNSCKYEAEITVPQGIQLNIGKAAQQESSEGNVYKGGGDQVLLPNNWQVEHLDWITDIRVLKENEYE